MKIKTYDTKSFRDKFVTNEESADPIFKVDFEIFFSAKLEDINKLAKFPITPSKENSHSIIFVSEGVYQAKIGFKEYQIQPNEILIVPAGQIFSLDGIEEGVSGFTCHFHPDFLIGKLGSKELTNQFDFLKIWGDCHVMPLKQTAFFLFQLFNRIQIEYASNGIQQKELVLSYLFAILFELNTYTTKNREKPTSATKITQQFRELLFLHSKEKQKVTDYADLLHISPNHLNKSVKETTGKSPTTWIDEAIINEAKYLLFQTSLTINEISYQVGVEDQSYFSRIFKKYEGVTPAEFKRMIEKS
ncbi:MAG: helix-turn-helix domain-containing protein [Leadbetterella sp.]